MIIKDKEYIGVIKEGADHQLSGKYLVHIRELMSSDSSLKPIWAHNEINGGKFSRWVDFKSKTVRSAGSYQPLYEGMMVNVKFRSNSMESAYITNIVSYLPLVDKSEMRDSFYLLNKTLNGSWIYQDDARNITHIMHNNGKSNIILDDDGITLHTGMPIENGVGGVLLKNAFHVGAGGTKLEFGNASIVLDETGISFKIGDTQMTMTESGIKMHTKGNTEIESEKNIKIKSKDLHVQGSEELQLFSNVVRLTGSTQASVISNTINITGASNATIRSTIGEVVIDGMVKTKITAPILELTSLTNINLDAPTMYIGSQNLTINAPSMAISSASLMMDGTINHGMGIAKGLGTSMSAMNKTLAVATDAANIAMVTALGTNDVVTGIVNSSIVGTVPGAARPVGEIVKQDIVHAKIGFSVSEKISYLTSSNESYNQVVEDQFKGLRETHELYR